MLSIATPALPILPPQYQLANLTGYLTQPSAAEPLDIARAYLTSHASQLALTAADVSQAIVTDCYQDSDTGITHIYLRQGYNGLEVSDANFVVNVAADGRLINVAGGFVAGLNDADSASSASSPSAPPLTPDQALASLAVPLGLSASAISAVPTVGRAANEATTLEASSLSLDSIPAKLHYVPAADGGVDSGLGLRLADAGRRALVRRQRRCRDAASASGVHDWVDHASYNVFARPVESPADGSRSIVTDPQDSRGVALRLARHQRRGRGGVHRHAGQQRLCPGRHRRQQHAAAFGPTAARAQLRFSARSDASARAPTRAPRSRTCSTGTTSATTSTTSTASPRWRATSR